jgi:hypothetical protein
VSYKDDIERLIFRHNRRLQKLRERQAIQGHNVDPEISIEIEDIEARIQKFQAQLKKIKDTEEKIEELQAELEKLGAVVKPTRAITTPAVNIPDQPVMQYDPINIPNISTVITQYMQSSSYIALHKGNFLAGEHRPLLQKALKEGKNFRILLCQNHPAVNHQLWFRSERHREDKDGPDMIGSQIEIGYRNIDALRRNLTEKEKRRLKVRLIPYVVPDPFCVIDHNRSEGLVLAFIRNFRDQGNAAPFLIFRRSSHQELFKFFVRQFETLWEDEAATSYSGK